MSEFNRSREEEKENEDLTQEEATHQLIQRIRVGKNALPKQTKNAHVKKK